MESDGEVIQRQHFCHQGDTICHPTRVGVDYNRNRNRLQLERNRNCNHNQIFQIVA